MIQQFTKIHFVRHAESISNKENRLSGGGNDVPLTELGKKQASDRGEALVKYKDNISYIVHSDMIRTSQTTDGINKRLNLEIRYDADLREQYFGTLDGKKTFGS